MKFLKEPFFHFLILGAGLFLVFHFLGGDRNEKPGRIVVDPAKIEGLVLMFERTWQRPPNPQETEGLIQDYIKEEILYREALKLGLDQDDTIIRRRLKQKMEFLSEDLSPPREPTEAELEIYLKEHAEDFRIEPRFTFRQFFLNPEIRGPRLTLDAETLLAELNRGGIEKAARRGDPLLLSNSYEKVSLSEIAKDFGDKFAASLTGLESGKWRGPIKSGFGVHLVFVEERTEGRTPTLSEVREKVKGGWESARQRQAAERSFQELRKRYEVVIEAGSKSETPKVATEASR